MKVVRRTASMQAIDTLAGDLCEAGASRTLICADLNDYYDKAEPDRLLQYGLRLFMRTVQRPALRLDSKRLAVHTVLADLCCRDAKMADAATMMSRLEVRETLQGNLVAASRQLGPMMTVAQRARLDQLVADALADAFVLEKLTVSVAMDASAECLRRAVASDLKTWFLMQDIVQNHLAAFMRAPAVAMACLPTLDGQLAEKTRQVDQFFTDIAPGQRAQLASQFGPDLVLYLRHKAFEEIAREVPLTKLVALHAFATSDDGQQFMSILDDVYRDGAVFIQSQLEAHVMSM